MPQFAILDGTTQSSTVYIFTGTVVPPGVALVVPSRISMAGFGRVVEVGMVEKWSVSAWAWVDVSAI